MGDFASFVYWSEHSPSELWKIGIKRIFLINLFTSVFIESLTWHEYFYLKNSPWEGWYYDPQISHIFLMLGRKHGFSGVSL